MDVSDALPLILGLTTVTMGVYVLAFRPLDRRALLLGTASAVHGVTGFFWGIASAAESIEFVTS